MTRTAPGRPTAEDDTPMMQQYQRIKKDYPDAILFFRMGDFYEMFLEDAKVASKILEITLTSRNKNNPIPMCGIPHHSANLYISKLIKSGKSIAVCEQVEDPRQAKGLVKREVVRVITPGTVLDENLLDPKNHHFLVSLYFGKESSGLASLDISTGLFHVMELPQNNCDALLSDELTKLEPREVIVPESAFKDNGTSQNLLQQESYCLRPREDWTFSYTQARRVLLEHFKTQSLEGFGCEALPSAICAAGALIHYLKETQKTSLQHINSLSTISSDHFMQLDQSTVASLELVQSSDGQRKHSLLGLLDESCTPMGARRIKDWILKPLIRMPEIVKRQELIEEFKNNLLQRNEARELLKSISDMARLLSRISLSACSPRDLVALKTSIQVLPNLETILRAASSPHMTEYISAWDNLQPVFELIEKTLSDPPPLQIRDGNLIQSGCNPELDRLKTITRNGNQLIADLEARERKQTHIPQLKVGYNKIYGYYIEVTKKNLDRIPDNYIRKQSLVNTERFISPELKEYESEIMGAEEKIQLLEQQLFQDLRLKVAEYGTRIQSMAFIISEIDAFAGLAEVAHRHNYCRPILGESDVLNIKNGRHPLVEGMESDHSFIPNDTLLDCQENQILIITGPNMAGKSTYLRQVALITLMAHIGSFVPAEEAEVGMVDRIFSRVGAQDHLAKGQSTFMVEMNEAANILNNATEKSLLILDEIGRGTSTFDGISIAWSIIEYLEGPRHIGAKTLFATHYHELTELAQVYPGIKNYYVQVKEWNDEIIFLRKILPGGADKSYGIQVARLAGLPEAVLKRAHEVLFNLENSEFDELGTPKLGLSQDSSHPPHSVQLGLFPEPTSPLIQLLKEINPDDLTPRQALEKLYELIRHFQKLES